MCSTMSKREDISTGFEISTVFAKINAHLEINAPKGGAHKTDGSWWVIFKGGEYTKPMAFDGFWNVFYCF